MRNALDSVVPDRQAAFHDAPPPPGMSQAATARPARLVSLEIARFLAALVVALEHLSTAIPDMRIGRAPLPPLPAPAAVLFFFTLSGFVIYNAHAGDAGFPARVPAYAWRRFCRIFPLYWLSLLPMLAVLWPGCTAGYLAQIFTLDPFTGNIAELNPPAWTLRYELLFYIVFGLSLLPYARRVVLPGWGVLLAAAWYADLRGWGSLLTFLPPGVSAHFLALNNIFFFAGIAAAWLLRRESLQHQHRRLLWPLLGAAALALALLLRPDDWGTLYPADPRLPFTAAAFAAIILLLAALERRGDLRLNPRWAMLGALSYPLYLLHSGAGFIFSADFFFHPADRASFTPWPLFGLMLGIALAASAAAAFLIDAPLQRHARRLA